jgi:molecular chaperone GrpE (heat shock protein)
LPNQKLTKTVIEKLQLSAEELGYTKNWVAFGNLLADQEKLSEFCTTSKVLTNNIFGDCIFLKLNSDKGKVVIKKFGNRIKAESLFHKSIASDSGKRIINDIIDHHKKEEVTSFIDTKMEQTPNEFMSRVLQVKLWTMGLYPGILDNDFGPVSLKALDDFLMTIVDKQIKGRKELGKILFNLQNNQCILNINYLLTTYLIPMEKSELNFKQSSVSQIFDFILEDKTSKNSLKNKQKIYARQNQLTRSLKKELHTESDKIINGEKRTVRLYKAKKGIMKFFSKLFKFLKNTYDQLVALFKKLMNLIKKVSKIIYDEIREAFKSFSDGLKFLFGKRNIKPTPYISSDFDFDFDCVTRIHSKPGLEDIEVHTKTISGYASAVYPTLNFVRIVIQWGLKFATGPIGWVKILIGIAKLFKEMHSRRTILQMA